jgi:predicted nucleotidyltransferase
MPAAKDTRTSRDRVAAYRARRRQQGLRQLQIWVPDTVSAKAAAEERRQAPADDPILRRYRAALDQIYGERIERVVLYGSRARGDAYKESDYDVALFLHGMSDRWQELDRLADLSTKIVEEDGPLIHAMPFAAGAYDYRTPLMHAIRADGVDL